MTFSVVIPVHNTARYLRACLDSLLAQTFQDWEAVCVDDGSTDESGAILDGYAAKDGRFRVIHQTNAGVSAARNAGLGHACGAWVCFADSDDLLHCRLLETYNRLINGHREADLVSVDSVKFLDDAELSWPTEGELGVCRLDVGRTITLAAFQIGICTQAFRRGLLNGLKFPALQIGEDRVFVCELVKRAQSVVISDFVGYGYRQRGGSLYHARGTAGRFLDHLRHYLLMSDCLLRSEKEVELDVFRKIGLEMTEYLAFDYRRLPTSDRRQVWAEWRTALRTIGHVRQVPLAPRLVARVVGSTGSRMLMWILCWGVGWLKLHGVNRRLSVHHLEDVG